jgi:protein Tex
VELEKPGRDPRPAFQTAQFKEGVETLEDLQVGMILEGVVSNVAAFGAFVDVGVHQDGLVHISAMSNSYVADPRDVVKPGDIVKVKVLDVDLARKRISLSLRLDDAPAKGGRSGQGGRDSQGGQGGGGRGRGRGRRRDGRDGRDGGGNRDGGSGADTAMADALRRAGLL